MDECSSGALGTSEKIALWALLATLVGQFVVPELPSSLQDPTRVTFALLGALAIGYFLLSHFGRRLARRLSPIEVDYQYDRMTGLATLGGIPNVSLRVESLHLIVDTLVGQIPENRRQVSLYESGRIVGVSWGDEIKKQQLARYQNRSCVRKLLEEYNKEYVSDTKELLNIWTRWDAGTQIGVFDFSGINEYGCGEVRVRHSYLAKFDAVSEIDLDWLTAGYIAGGLTKVFQRGKPLRVSVVESNPKKHYISRFRVSNDPCLSGQCPSR